MKHKTTKRLYSYWNDVRGARIAPLRFDIEPARLNGVLPDTFMLERLGRNIYRFRLAGTRVCETFGSDFRGMDFMEGWTPEDAQLLTQDMAVISEQGGVCLFNIQARTVSGEVIELEILILPLVHTEGTIDRYLGSICPLDKPDWLGSERLAFKRLLRHEVIWPDGRPHKAIERTHRQVPFLPHVRNARIVRQDRRQFRVYEGGLSKTGGEDV